VTSYQNSIDRKTNFLCKLFEQEVGGLNKNLNYISHLKTSISIAKKQAMETQHNIKDMKEQLELELERERNKKLDAIYVSPLAQESRKRTMSQFMPSFENILASSSSEDSHTQGAPSSASMQLSRATGSSVQLSESQVTVNVDVEDSSTTNSTSTSTSTDNTAKSDSST
jgi:hypothetical protein